MSRHHCKICNKRRDEKFMLQVPFELSSSLGLSTTYLCQRPTARHSLSNKECIEKFKKEHLTRLNNATNLLLDLK